MSDIMSISRLRMGTDGKGITTLVGFHGCPLKCRYCVNDHCHHMDTIRADYTAEELVSVLAVDEPYFLMTGGGITFGGGEPLLQAHFIHEVCQQIGKRWKCNIETSLYTDWESVKLLVDDIDYWYVDIKEIDAGIYESYTGKSNKKPIANLKKLVEVVDPKKICVRLPLIPRYNSNESRERGAVYVWENISPLVVLDIFEYIRC